MFSYSIHAFNVNLGICLAVSVNVLHSDFSAHPLNLVTRHPSAQMLLMRLKPQASHLRGHTPQPAWDRRTAPSLQEVRCCLRCDPSAPAPLIPEAFPVAKSALYYKMDYEPRGFLKNNNAPSLLGPRDPGSFTPQPALLTGTQQYACPSLYLERSLPSSFPSSRLNPCHLIREVFVVSCK